MTIYTLVALIAAIALGVTILRYIFFRYSSSLLAYLQDFIGVFFIFSGFVKAIDPLGTSYKIHDYFAALNIGELDPLALPLSVITIVLEIVVGVALIIGYRKQITLWLFLLLIVFFTFLTGYTYLNGWTMDPWFAPWKWVFDENNMKVTDCGCFGDFIKLHPRQSFIKDIFLGIAIIVLYIFRLRIKPILTPMIRNIVIIGNVVGLTIFCFSNYVWDLPHWDFRPYAVGNNIPEQMVPVPGEEPVYEITYVYLNKTTGEKENFVVGKDQLPADKKDTTKWEFISRPSVLVSGAEPKIQNFAVFDDISGDEMTDAILNDPNYAFWVIAYDLENTEKEAFTEKLNPLSESAKAEGYNFFTVAAIGNLEEFRHDVQAPYPFYSADPTFLKTIIRSNPGLLIVKDGAVMGKWHHKHIPSYNELKETILKK